MKNAESFFGVLILKELFVAILLVVGVIRLLAILLQKKVLII